MIESASPPPPSREPPEEREHFFGPWLDEAAACAEFDRRVAASRLFERSFPEVRGYYLTHRPNRQSKDARIDRILLPGPRLREAGWTTAIGVELKASGTKLGPPLSQAIDYTYCAFHVGPHWLHLQHIFFWPLRPQRGAVQSVMVQNCIGCIFDTQHSPLIFELERQVICLHDDDNLVVHPSVAGTKKGSR
ncbi:MAG TPA: hypothetical protein VIX73_36900 [Kofleriaceae bacterium]|jgi:hypothetical protein